MAPAHWRESVMAYIRAEALPVDKFGHQPRLYALAARLGEDVAHDDDILFASAWMHDLGVFTGHRPEDPPHNWRGGTMCPTPLRGPGNCCPSGGFPAEKLEGVTEAIRTPPAPGRAGDDRGDSAAGCRHSGAIGRDWRATGAGQDWPRHAVRDLFVGVAGPAQGPGDPAGKLRLEQARRLAAPPCGVDEKLIAAIEDEAGELLF